jgi:hypothetical protein
MGLVHSQLIHRRVAHDKKYNLRIDHLVDYTLGLQFPLLKDGVAMESQKLDLSLARDN